VALFGHLLVTAQEQTNNNTDGELDKRPIPAEGHDFPKQKDTVSIKEYLTYIVQPPEEEGPVIAASAEGEHLVTSEPHTALNE
jgi:hypothetical protein